MPCTGVQLHAGPLGVMGPMELVCITCGAVVARYKPSGTGADGAIWIRTAMKLVDRHRKGLPPETAKTPERGFLPPETGKSEALPEQRPTGAKA